MALTALTNTGLTKGLSELCNIAPAACRTEPHFYTRAYSFAQPHNIQMTRKNLRIPGRLSKSPMMMDGMAPGSAAKTEATANIVISIHVYSTFDCGATESYLNLTH